MDVDGDQLAGFDGHEDAADGLGGHEHGLDALTVDDRPFDHADPTDDDGGPDGSAREMRIDPAPHQESHAVDTAADATGPSRGNLPGGVPSGPAGIVVDTPQGPSQAGAATVDTTGDGRLDTVVEQRGDGSTLVVTDVDGDGHADYVTEVDRDGGYRSLEHTGEAEWAVVDEGTLGGGSGQQAASPVVTTDPRTGGWAG